MSLKFTQRAKRLNIGSSFERFQLYKDTELCLVSHSVISLFSIEVMRVISCRLYLEQSDFHEKFSGGSVILDRSSESVTCQTFELTLRSCLYPHIERRYVECCGNLMRTLKKEYRWDWTCAWTSQCCFVAHLSLTLSFLIIFLGFLGTCRPWETTSCWRLGILCMISTRPSLTKSWRRRAGSSWHFLTCSFKRLLDSATQRKAAGTAHESLEIYRIILLPKPCLITLYILWLFIFPTHILLMIPGCLYFLKPLTL